MSATDIFCSWPYLMQAVFALLAGFVILAISSIAVENILKTIAVIFRGHPPQKVDVRIIAEDLFDEEEDS